MSASPLRLPIRSVPVTRAPMRSWRTSSRPIWMSYSGQDRPRLLGLDQIGQPMEDDEVGFELVDQQPVEQEGDRPPVHLDLGGFGEQPVRIVERTSFKWSAPDRAFDPADADAQPEAGVIAAIRSTMKRWPGPVSRNATKARTSASGSARGRRSPWPATRRPPRSVQRRGVSEIGQRLSGAASGSSGVSVKRPGRARRRRRCADRRAAG